MRTKPRASLPSRKISLDAAAPESAPITISAASVTATSAPDRHQLTLRSLVLVSASRAKKFKTQSCRAKDACPPFPPYRRVHARAHKISGAYLERFRQR